MIEDSTLRWHPSSQTSSLYHLILREKIRPPPAGWAVSPQSSIGLAPFTWVGRGQCGILCTPHQGRRCLYSPDSTAQLYTQRISVEWFYPT
ncbi:hypothetical protein AVEN_138931-1 [Araneus ventricosus]|uniref:Uncharacterized protein n=1 Tax=Araneus ventricosus TaxID=182803 RepID=A0A4Y2KCM2_ARAVE|nr:hypothetical protein AVEN_138931-1 [Araneus ventricosus]